MKNEKHSIILLDPSVNDGKCDKILANSLTIIGMLNRNLKASAIQKFHITEISRSFPSSRTVSSENSKSISLKSIF